MICRLTFVQHAIDIEATIRNGAFDVGIFAPEQMLSLEDSKNLMGGVAIELRKVSETVE
jgi:hypothetical protein